MTHPSLKIRREPGQYYTGIWFWRWTCLRCHDSARCTNWNNCLTNGLSHRCRDTIAHREREWMNAVTRTASRPRVDTLSSLIQDWHNRKVTEQ